MKQPKRIRAFSALTTRGPSPTPVLATTQAFRTIPAIRTIPGLLAVAALAATLLAGAAARPARAAQPITLEPLLASKGGWLNGTATKQSLAGKVVIVDVFTVECINCRNVTPNLRKLSRENASDVAIVGIHTPETPYEKDRATVVSNLKALGVVWPVAVDNDMDLWNAYGVQYWPTQFIFDRHGRLRQTVIGDSQDDAVDATVRQLIAEK